jgi:hypothetical protein
MDVDGELMRRRINEKENGWNAEKDKNNHRRDPQKKRNKTQL